jgi:hypothetical protein
MLRRMIDESIEYACTNQMSIEHLKEMLRAIKTRIAEALSINVSSERLVNSLIEDTMDLAALRMKKFKRQDSTFEVHQPFDEVVSVIAFKA